jgi:NAD(P)-dependent dehydrogenase (short-subunit alcohol dehydrogenase family)
VRAAAAVADVADLAAVEEAVVTLEAALGTAVLLVNNAGVIEADEVPIWWADPAEWARVIEVDLIGVFHVVRSVVPRMLAHERRPVRVVNLSSGAAIRDTAVYTAYHAAKTGLTRITTALHLAGAEQGLLAFDVSPGVVRTDMTAGMRMHDDRQDWTPVDALTDLVRAVGRGDVDAWSGRHLRAGIDTVPALDRRAAEGLDPHARRVRLHRWGTEDPHPL